MSEQTAFVLASGLIFGVVALFHAVRLGLRWKVRVGSRELPLWVSVVGFALTAGLSAWAFWLLL